MDAGDDDFAFDGKVGEKKNITVRHGAGVRKTLTAHGSKAAGTYGIGHHGLCLILFACPYAARRRCVEDDPGGGSGL